MEISKPKVSLNFYCRLVNGFGHNRTLVSPLKIWFLNVELLPCFWLRSYTLRKKYNIVLHNPTYVFNDNDAVAIFATLPFPWSKSKDAQISPLCHTLLRTPWYSMKSPFYLMSRTSFQATWTSTLVSINNAFVFNSTGVYRRNNERSQPCHSEKKSERKIHFQSLREHL